MKKEKDQMKVKALLVGAALLLAACGDDRATTDDTRMEDTDTTMMETDTTGATTMMDTASTVQMGGMMGHMHMNMDEMRRLKMTGDPDRDYAQMMAMHHQGAIRMAEEEVNSGTNNKLKEIANRTIKTNRADIQKLQNFQNTHKGTTGDTAATMRMMQPMKKMMGDMDQKSMSMGTNTDQNFAQMMISHHQSGIEMSREFMKQGKTQEMKQMAQKTIDQQQKDIKELEAWQKQNKQ